MQARPAVSVSAPDTSSASSAIATVEATITASELFKLQLRFAARLFGGEHVPMRNQRVNQVGDVQKEQHGRDAEAQFLVGDAQVARMTLDVAGVVEYCRKQKSDDDEDKERGEQAGPLGVESLPFSRRAADHNGQPQAEQAGADDRPGDLRLNHRRLAAGEHEEGQHQLGDTAKAHGQQTADGRAHALCELLGGPADPFGEDRNRDYGRDEYPERRGADKIFQSQG